MITILLVDDQNLVQQGIKSLLDQDSRFKVVGTVRDGQSAIRQINLLHPDIVLLDIEMPGMNGISVTKYVNHFLPETKVMILSSHEEKKYVVQALVAGAKAYILKDSLMMDLKQAILAVNNGYSQVESRLMAKVLNPSNIRPPISIPQKSEQRTGKQNEVSQQDKKPQRLLSRPSSFFVTRNEEEHQQHQGQGEKDNQDNQDNQDNHQDSGLYQVATEPKILPVQEPSFTTSKQKTQINPDRIERTPQPTAEIRDDQEKTLVDLVNQAKLDRQEQNGDRLFYGPPHVRNNIKSSDGNSNALVLTAPPRSHSQHGIRFQLSQSQKPSLVLIAVKKHWEKLNANPEVTRYRLKLVTFLQPAIFRYQPLFNRYKAKALVILAQRDTQKLLQNIGLMVLGGIIVLIFHSL